MARKSKYLGKEFDHGWKCTHMGIANVQGRKAAAPGAINHYYVFERITSDNKAEKLIRLNSTEAAKVYRGEITIEEISRKRKDNHKFTRKISYNFIDRG